jgi:hypothetical protein
LSSRLLKKTVDEFHVIVYMIEVEPQKRGIFSAANVLTPPTIEFELEERDRVSKWLFELPDDLDEG